MKRALLICTAVIAMATIPMHGAKARDGGFGLGLASGLAAGTVLGVVAGQPRYYAPPPVYVEPVEVEFEAPPPAVMVPGCYWTRGAPVWDEYQGVWMRPRIKVCE